MRYLLLFLSAACDAEHGLVKIEKPFVNQALGGIWGGGEYVLIATDGQVLWWEPRIRLWYRDRDRSNSYCEFCASQR